MLKIEKINIKKIKEYSNNSKEHPEWQVEQIKDSITEFGFNDPIVLDEDYEIIEGHGRYKALLELGHSEIECIILDNLNENQKKAYRLVHNKLNMNTGFNEDILNSQLKDLETKGFDTTKIGFTLIDEEKEEELVLDDYDDDSFEVRDKLICPDCSYIGNKDEFLIDYEY